MSYIDLHTHSSASDGTDTPSELVAKAASLDLGAIALTDHDTISGLAEAESAASELGLTFIRGCELSTTTPMGEAHILGLWLPEDCSSLEAFLKKQRDMRKDRNLKIAAKLRSYGLDITMEEIEVRAKGSIGRPHFAAALIEKGYAKNHEDAFKRWLGSGGKAYVPKSAPGPADAVLILSKLGATAVMAHPLLRPWPTDWLENLVGDLVQRGLSALEAWHSSHSEAQTSYIISLAGRLKIGLSGGSDYHGKAKPDIALGSGKGNLRIPEQVLHDLTAMRRRLGLPVYR